MKKDYLFTSQRLGFRNWKADDLNDFAQINADVEVMQHFPKPLEIEETAALITRFKNHYAQYGYTYFAVELLEARELIGFIGLAQQDYPSPFTPAVDIGWRLKKSTWGKGLATEGAKKCLQWAFATLELPQVIAVCTENNQRSEAVMKKLGMAYLGAFNHPKLKAYPQHEKCLCYGLKKQRCQ